MRVFRVEHSAVERDGRPAGPYSDESFCIAEHDGMYAWELDCEPDECIHTFSEQIGGITGSRCPVPSRDGIDYVSHDDLFCFTSVDMYRRWFAGYRRKLSRFGFVIGVYEVPVDHTQHGYSQSTFSYAASVRVGEVGLMAVKQLQNMLDNAPVVC